MLASPELFLGAGLMKVYKCIKSAGTRVRADLSQFGWCNRQWVNGSFAERDDDNRVLTTIFELQPLKGGVHKEV